MRGRCDVNINNTRKTINTKKIELINISFSSSSPL
jgi:hypothetical protein